MRVVIDIETDRLYNPTEIWVIVAKDIDTNKHYIFREVTKNADEASRFQEFTKHVTCYIGHNFVEFDYPCIDNLLHIPTIDRTCINVIDTLIVSRLVNYNREHGHSLNQYGRELGFEKGKTHYLDFFKAWSQPLEDYCVRDVDLTHKVYLGFLGVIDDPAWTQSIRLEHQFQLILNSVHDRGFAFNSSEANVLLKQVEGELHELDTSIKEVFLPRPRAVGEVHPKLTQYGTLNRSQFRFVKDGDLSEYNGGPFTRLVYQPFNAASHKQVIDVLHQAGWSPTERTDTHVKTLREISKSKRSHDPNKALVLAELSAKLEGLEKYGWKVNENNLSSLPSSAPPPARLLSKRILRESRRRTLTEWLSLLSPDGRVHGEFQGIGAWTHRMAHQKPNLANIPNEFYESGLVKYLGKELRSLWMAPPGRLLAGIDAEGIQLRIFAHYVNDPELIKSLVDGRKADKTDPHSLNQRVLGRICKTRQAAKRFLYSLLLGGGVSKFSQILECTEGQAKEAVDIFNQRYPGFAYLKREQFPSDAKRGFFIGLDGRRVPVPGTTSDERKHLLMSGYLQCGEAVIIKLAATRFFPELEALDTFLVDIVHDEYQLEVPNKEIGLEVCKIVADSIKWAGEELKLNCPMAGSFYDEDHKRHTIGNNWYETH